jgi:hypothetical protein
MHGEARGPLFYIELFPDPCGPTRILILFTEKIVARGFHAHLQDLLTRLTFNQFYGNNLPREGLFMSIASLFSSLFIQRILLMVYSITRLPENVVCSEC